MCAVVNFLNFLFRKMIVAKLQLEETDVTLMNFANSHQTSFASFYSVFLPLSKEEYRM